MLALPCPRTSLAVKQREVFNACGEGSTHFGSYTGVQPLSLRRMAKVRSEDKQAILAKTGELASPPPRLGASLNGAVPIFWQERKPTAFWRQLLNDLDVRAVCDLTPGSGVLAHACLMEGWPYIGVTATAAHCSYMQNRLDRDAVGIISMSGSAMYDEDLAGLIKQHFADIVDEVHAADATGASDEEAEGEDDDDDDDEQEFVQQ